MNLSRHVLRQGVLLWCAAILGLISPLPPAGAARIAGEAGTTEAAPAQGSSDKPAAGKPAKPLPQARLLEKTRAATPQPPPKAEAAAPPESVSGDRGVTIDFDNVDITLFIKFISELTGKNFVVDRAVKGTVTVISPTTIGVEEAYKVFESVLEVNGFATVPSGSVIKVVPAVQARAKGVETRLRPERAGPEDRMVTQVIPLAYANPEELKTLFTPLISQGSVMVAYPPTRTLIVTDMLSNIERLLRIIKEVDLQAVGEEISVIPLQFASAGELAKSLNSVYPGKIQRAQKTTSEAQVTKIVADERSNSLVVFASEQDADRIRRLIRLLDREMPKGAGNIHVYYLQNAIAEDLAKVLTALPLKEDAKTKGKPGKAPAVSEDVLIVADKATNSLVITASKDDYQVMEEVIRKLDISRQMVYIEALIMEVSVDKEFDLGVEWKAADDFSYKGGDAVAFGASTSGQGVSPSVDAATGALSLPTGLIMGILGQNISIGGVLFPNLSAVIRAYRKDADVYIRSAPQLLTTDNQEAEIRVGKTIPFLTRQETTTAQVDYSSYEYKDVGVTLNITPQINLDRFVFLKIAQELTQVVKEESQVGLPTTLKRSAKTAVVVKDGHTVVIGGLIDQTMSEGEVKVPYLGDIPLLGWLFKSQSKNRGRTNLFIFLTPHIVDNPAQAREVFEEKKTHMDALGEGVIKMYEGKDAGRKEPARE